MWLSDEEIRVMTRRVKPSAQKRVLEGDGIPYRMVDGRPMVLRSDVMPQRRRREAVRLNLSP